MPLTHLKLETKTIQLAGRTVLLTVPSNPADVLNSSVESSQEAANDPYWGVLWPAAEKTAAMILNRDWGKKPADTLEVGCGVGLVGIAALMCGHRVTFSDAVPQAVELAALNAAQNGFQTAVSLVLDWGHPIEKKFDLIIASDVLYEVTHHQPLLNVMSRMLSSDGEVLLGDMGRGNAIRFIETAVNDGWKVNVFNDRHQELSCPVRQQFQLFRLTQRNPREIP